MLTTLNICDEFSKVFEKPPESAQIDVKIIHFPQALKCKTACDFGSIVTRASPAIIDRCCHLACCSETTNFTCLKSDR